VQLFDTFTVKQGVFIRGNNYPRGSSTPPRHQRRHDDGIEFGRTGITDARGKEKREQRDQNTLMSPVSSHHIAETFPQNAPFGLGFARRRVALCHL
jgi:hypothetical protein